MDFYYHPILGLQYKTVFEIERGNFVWKDGIQDTEVILISDPKGTFSFMKKSQNITTNSIL